jgi:hypothetical protein
MNIRFNEVLMLKVSVNKLCSSLRRYLRWGYIELRSQSAASEEEWKRSCIDFRPHHLDANSQ